MSCATCGEELPRLNCSLQKVAETHLQESPEQKRWWDSAKRYLHYPFEFSEVTQIVESKFLTGTEGPHPVVTGWGPGSLSHRSTWASNWQCTQGSFGSEGGFLGSLNPWNCVSVFIRNFLLNLHLAFWRTTHKNYRSNKHHMESGPWSRSMNRTKKTCIHNFWHMFADKAPKLIRLRKNNKGLKWREDKLWFAKSHLAFPLPQFETLTLGTLTLGQAWKMSSAQTVTVLELVFALSWQESTKKRVTSWPLLHGHKRKVVLIGIQRIRVSKRFTYPPGPGQWQLPLHRPALADPGGTRKNPLVATFPWCSFQVAEMHWQIRRWDLRQFCWYCGCISRTISSFGLHLSAGGNRSVFVVSKRVSVQLPIQALIPLLFAPGEGVFFLIFAGTSSDFLCVSWQTFHVKVVTWEGPIWTQYLHPPISGSGTQQNKCLNCILVWSLQHQQERF